MLESLDPLPDDPQDLKGLVTLMGEEIKALTLKIEDLQGQLAGHRKARFGPKSESLQQLTFDLHAYSTASDRLFQQHPTSRSTIIRPVGGSGLRQSLHC